MPASIRVRMNASYLRLVLAWLRIVLHLILIVLRQAFTCGPEFKSAS